MPPEGADKPFTDAEWPAVRARLEGLAELVGLPIDPPRRNSNTRLALETMELVRAQRGDDAAGRFHHAVSRAFFTERADVADRALIERFAHAEGVPPDDVAAAWERHAYAEAVDASTLAALRAGARGVPAYGWAGGRATSGMMEPDRIVRVLEATQPRG